MDYQLARWMALGAIAGPLVFDTSSLVAGWARPSYSLVRQPLSALAIGGIGSTWMRGAFLAYSALVSAGVAGAAVALRRDMARASPWAWVVPALLFTSPVGVFVAGVWTMEPRSAALHTAGAQLAFGTQPLLLPLVGAVLCRSPRWRVVGYCMLVAGAVSAACLVGFVCSVPFEQMASPDGGGTLGLWQRALALAVQGAYVALGWRAFTRLTIAGRREA